MDENRQGESDAVILSLLRRIEASDWAALESLLARFQDAVLRFFLRAGCGYHDARDLTQETLLASVSRFDTFDPHRSKFETWLLGIARRERLAWLRSSERRMARLERYREAKGPEIEAGEVFEPATEARERDEAAAELEQAIEELPPKQRDAMQLVVGGFGTTEVAETLGISPAGARRRIRIAMKKIRSRWERKRREER